MPSALHEAFTVMGTGDEMSGFQRFTAYWNAACAAGLALNPLS